MSFSKNFTRGVFCAILHVALLPASAHAQDIAAHGSYARTSGASASSGAIFLTLENKSDVAVRLVGARTQIAAKTELHTHLEGDNGVMMMRQIEGGIEIPAKGMHVLKRGGDHVMLMGLTAPLADGDMITLTLVFEKAGEIAIDVVVDSSRKPTAHTHTNMDE